ncbi:MAG: RusA family crossover junction endodeoxyribonuclease, partial [Gemmatimonadaceae bacterium]|nr:RusA family crossover junction endodeoxyribonuclease [Gemmatimonadaceae bacterium]
MTTLSFTVSGVPVAWQRTRVVTYPRLRFVNPTALTEWQDQVARVAITALRSSSWRLVGQYAVTAEFRLPMPPSWSNKKRLAMIGQPHAQKPDIDNLLKAVLEIMS